MAPTEELAPLAVARREAAPAALVESGEQACPMAAFRQTRPAAAGRTAMRPPRRHNHIRRRRGRYSW
jgi:hypothetical protein